MQYTPCYFGLSFPLQLREGYKYKDISIITLTYYLYRYFFCTLPLLYSNHSYLAAKTNLEKMVLLRSQEVKPLKAKPKTPIINYADFDANKIK
jgi:NhaP-type Na+/H+ or K+/H+ antiporter